MSFGVYRPTMGVPGGHRELVSNQSLHKQRQMGEQMRRQETNPITGEPVVAMGGRPPSGSTKPVGNLGAGLVPNTGPLEHVMTNEKEVPSKRVDPTKNQSTSFQSGVSCLGHESLDPPRMQPWSRLTESNIGEGLCERRTPTPDRGGSSSRRSTPGQVVKGNMRPKDSLSGGGCVASDIVPEHPLNLPRKFGSVGAAVGSGGTSQIRQGPNGFVPFGPEDFDMPMAPPRAASRERPFQRACGAAVFAS